MVRRRRRRKNNHFQVFIYIKARHTHTHTHAAHGGTGRNSFCKLQKKMFTFTGGGGSCLRVNFTLCAPCAWCRFQCKQFCTLTKSDVDLFMYYIVQFVSFFSLWFGVVVSFLFICFSFNCNGNDFGKQPSNDRK